MCQPSTRHKKKKQPCEHSADNKVDKSSTDKQSQKRVQKGSPGRGESKERRADEGEECTSVKKGRHPLLMFPIVISIVWVTLAFCERLKAPMKGESTTAKNTCSTEVDDGDEIALSLALEIAKSHNSSQLRSYTNYYNR